MKRDFTHNIKAKECNRKISDDIEEIIQNKFGKKHDIRQPAKKPNCQLKIFFHCRLQFF